MTNPLSLVHLQDPGRKVRLNGRQEICIATQSRSGVVLHVTTASSAGKGIRTVG